VQISNSIIILMMESSCDYERTDWALLQ